MRCKYYRTPQECPEFEPTQCIHPNNKSDFCCQGYCPCGWNSWAIEFFRIALVKKEELDVDR